MRCTRSQLPGILIILRSQVLLPVILFLYVYLFIYLVTTYPLFHSSCQHTTLLHLLSPVINVSSLNQEWLKPPEVLNVNFTNLPPHNWTLLGRRLPWLQQFPSHPQYLGWKNYAGLFYLKIFPPGWLSRLKKSFI